MMPVDDLFAAARSAINLSDFWRLALPAASRISGCDQLAVARLDRGEWQVEASTGLWPLPTELLTQVLDRETVRTSGPWFGVPLLKPGNLVFVGRLPGVASADRLEKMQPLIGEFRDLSELIQRQERAGLRIERLQAILDVAGQWNRTLDMGELLRNMAEASTRLMHAERASIFLWDRAHRVLVGRPALGVDGTELRIPDTKGVVGQVIQTGQPQRVGIDEPESINRQVDRSLGFHTRNVLCVPLIGKRRKLFGAFELLNKRDGDFSEEDQTALVELAAHAATALENTQEYEQLIKARDQAADEAMQHAQMIGACPAIEALRSTVRRVADTDLAVLLLGENGTGKEVVSRRIHFLSRRRTEPFIAVNCAALTETLLESELFGHEKGAFTDAHATRAGKFESAAGGTLFLDEIGDMSLSGQAKLLRVLEEKVVVRVGGSVPIHTDARVVAATNQNLAELVRTKRFREDLFFRLNVVTLELPPLRDRGDDLLLLAEHFLSEFCIKARRRPPEFTAAARKRLQKHSWPGNVRELRNLMERIAYLSQGDKVDVDELAFILSPARDETRTHAWDLPLTEATRRFQMEYIQQQIEHARGNMTEAAERLGLHRSNLYRKMRQLDMPASEE